MSRTELAAWILVVGFAALPARAAEYRVSAGSEVGFTAKITASSFVASSSAVSGTLSYDPATSQLTAATIVLKTDSFRTGMDTRDEHLREKYLDTLKFPEIRFEVPAQAVALVPGAPVKLRGSFLIKGVRKEAELPLTVTRADEAGLTVKARFPLDITHFGIPQPKFAIVKMETVLDADVTIVFAAAK